MRRLTYTLMALLLFASSVIAQEATPEATPEVIAPAIAIPDEALPILVTARTDLELLANSELGSSRPTGWSGSFDVNDPSLGLLLRLDLELLVGKLYSLEERPVGWFGPIPGSSVSIARDIRHDLELLADTITAVNVRPPGWSGDRAIMRCDRATQTLVDLLEGNGFAPFADPTLANYCDLTAIQASQFAEANFVSVDAGGGVLTTAAMTEGETARLSGAAIQAAGDVAFAFMNRYATKRVGTIPEDVPFVPVARSYTQFSHMTLVQGANFEVFVDYKTTTLTEERFEDLPNVNDYGINIACEAEWCHDPVDMVSIFAPQSRPNQQMQLVNAGDNIVIHYDGGDDGQTTLVRMELCPQRTSVSRDGCQPVTTVIRPNGAAMGSTGQTINGIPQYRLPVQYSKISARTRDFYTNELWISPVGQR